MVDRGVFVEIIELCMVCISIRCPLDLNPLKILPSSKAPPSNPRLYQNHKLITSYKSAT